MICLEWLLTCLSRLFTVSFSRNKFTFRLSSVTHAILALLRFSAN